MKQNLHVTFAFLFAAFALAGPAIALQPEANAPAQASQTDSLTTGSIKLTEEQEEKKRIEDCMAIWDRDTHMTKRQWRRTCRRQLDEINSF